MNSPGSSENTDTLSRLTAALAEDERIARAALEADHPSVSEWDGLESNMFEHTQRHDPARVLRQVKVFQEFIASHTRDDWYELPDESTGSCEYCSSYCDERGCRNVVAWPCPTLRALAGIYDTEPKESES